MRFSGTRGALAAGFGLMALWLSSAAEAQFPPPSPANDLDAPGIIFAFGWPETRSRLFMDDLESGDVTGAPHDVAGFLPAGPLAGIGETLLGRLTLPDQALRTGDGPEDDIRLPATTVDLISHGDRLIPVQDPEDTVIHPGRRFTLHVGVGRIWQEAADGARSRALMPITLIDSHLRAAHNGLALFLHGGGAPPSPVLIQFTQESGGGRAIDLWASVAVRFEAGERDDTEDRIAAFEAQQATAPVFLDWDALPGSPSPALESFDGDYGVAGTVSASGIVLEETVYLKGCHTRTGPYPFCRQMRHALGEASGALLAFASVAHLTNRFGSEVFRDPISKRLPVLADHPVWPNATARDVLNMAVGFGARDRNHEAALMATTRDAILSASAAAPTGETSVGAEFVFRPGDLMTLSVALDAHAKARFGANGSLQEALWEGFFPPMGLGRVLMQVTEGPNDWDRVPDLVAGFYTTTDELARVLAALHRTADPTRKSGFDGALSREALKPDEALGFETGIAAEAGPIRWHLGFWRRPVTPSPGCERIVDSAAGRVGTVLSLMPNQVTGFRIADGADNPPGVWDDSGMRAAEHAARPFCG